MRILFCDRLVGLSMGVVHTYEVFRGLSRLNHEVIALYSDVPPGSPVKPAAAEHRPSPGHRIKKILTSSPLYRLLKGEILICWIVCLEMAFSARVLSSLIKRRSKIDVVHRRHNLFNGEYLLCRLFGKPLVREVNGLITDETRSTGASGISLRLMDWVERFSMPRADRIIVVTSKLKEVLISDYGVPEEKIVVIWNGANTELFRPMDTAKARATLGLSQHGNCVCFVGSLSPWQGVEYFIQAAPEVLARCPDTRFLVVGDGRMKEQLLNRAKELGIKDRFTFTGFLPYQEVPLYVNAADVCVAPFVMTRNERIGLSPLKLCEYLACGKPVVASKIAGLEILEESRAGTLVTPEDPKELAEAVIHLLQSPDLRIKMGNNGRRWVVEHRSWASVARKVAEVCQEAVEERKSRRRR